MWPQVSTLPPTSAVALGMLCSWERKPHGSSKAFQGRDLISQHFLEHPEKLPGEGRAGLCPEGSKGVFLL